MTDRRLTERQADTQPGTSNYGPRSFLIGRAELEQIILYCICIAVFHAFFQCFQCCVSTLSGFKDTDFLVISLLFISN